MNTYFLVDDHYENACALDDACVAVAIDWQRMEVGVRDTKDENKQTLIFSEEQWMAFIEAIKDGAFDISF